MSPERHSEAWSRHWASLALGAGIAVVAATLCRRGVILSDEGYLLLQSLDLANGKVLYRDMDAFVAPGVWFLLAGLFRIFEPSILVSRVAVWVCYLATLAVSWRIVARLAGPRWGWGCVGGLLVCTLWAFPAWTWSFYSPYAALFALAALERLLAWGERGRGRDLVWVGVWLGLSITFKQNYGAQALVGAALGFVALRFEAERSWSGAARALPAAGLRVALGLAAVGLPVLGYFAWQGALSHAFQALVVHPFGGFLGQHDIPYLPFTEFFERDRVGGLGRLTYMSYGLSHTAMRYDWPKSLVRGVELLHVLLYWIPPLVFAGAGALCLRSLRGRFEGGLAAALCVSGLLFLGVFPRADFHHLMQVYQPVLVVGTVVLARCARLGEGMGQRLAPRLRRAAFGVGGTLLGLYAGIAVYWYLDILRTLSHELPQPRGGVLVSLERRQMVEFEVGKMRENSRPGEAVLSMPGLSMINFLAERPMPGRYYNLYAVHIAHDEGAGVIEGMQESRVRLVLSDYNGFFSEIVGLRSYAPRLTDHLRRHFKPVAAVAVDEHVFLLRRPQPWPRRELVNALEDCDVGYFDWHNRGIQEHLLFDMLYHPLQSGDEVLRRQADTLCRVALPRNGVLAFAVGYRQPIGVGEGTQLEAEVWLRPLDRPDLPLERVFHETIEPGALFAWESPAHEEFRVDLSRWGGQDVLLMFRTLYAGDVETNELDFKGFTMVWQDPQIEHGGDAG